LSPRGLAYARRRCFCLANHKYTGTPRRITTSPATESRKLLTNV